MFINIIYKQFYKYYFSFLIKMNPVEQIRVNRQFDFVS